MDLFEKMKSIGEELIEKYNKLIKNPILMLTS